MRFVFRGWVRNVAILIAVGCVIGGVVTAWRSAAARSAANAVDCLPRPNLPLSWQVGDANDSHSPRGYGNWIASVLRSSSRPETVYLTTEAAAFYVGRADGSSWRRVPAVAPASLEFALGQHHDILYGSDGSALYRSTNQGRSWQRLICDVGVGTSATSAGGNPSFLYLAAEPGDDDWVTYGGLYRSRDGGKTWTRSRNGSDLWAIAAAPLNPNDVTVAPYSGDLYRATNLNNWSFTRLPGPTHPWDGQQVYSLSYGGPDRHPVLWAGTTGGVFRRTAHGTWVAAGLHRHGVSVLADARLSSVAFATLGLNPPDGRGCVRETTNGGRSWLPVRALPCAIRGMNIQRTDDVIYAWTVHRVFRSADHGSTWTRLPPLPTA